ncbi:MAG: cytochrome b/b6 domain-containing protein [Rhodocyclaceae bacterium]
MTSESRAERSRIKVWDAPTRLFHWSFAAAFAAAWASGESDRWRDVHVFAGYLILGLLAFRLVWGVAGSRHARFASFAFSWREARDYALQAIARRAPRFIGHNPAGAWAIFAMLALAALVSLSGILVLGGEEQQGLLTGWGRIATGAMLKELHDGTAKLWLLLIGLHLAGVAWESHAHRENLARSMLSGYKVGPASEAVASFRWFSALALAAAIGAFAHWYFEGYEDRAPGRTYLPFIGKTLPQSAQWNSECGSCHLAFHPSLLPARSWQALFAGQESHFGEVLGLDGATTAELLGFATKNSADAGMTEASFKIARSIPQREAPLRITETGYWKKKHAKVPESAWRQAEVRSRANCAACHLDAERGTFEDAAMRIPAGAPPAGALPR